VNWLQVSNTTKPVTHVADVDVNNALRKDMLLPLLLEIGNINNNVPISIMSANPKAIACAADILLVDINIQPAFQYYKKIIYTNMTFHK